LEKSLQHYINAANKGLLEAQKRLAVIYLGLDIFGQSEPPVITPDADASVKYLKMAIEQHGSKWSMLKLGDIYSVGLGTVAKNIEESERWYNEAASKGEPFGLYKIGNLYVKEKRDFENAIRWWKKAADRNCAEAHVQLGMLMLKGEKIDGRDVDLRRARDHFRAAVKLNPALRNDVPAEDTMERLIAEQDKQQARAARAAEESKKDTKKGKSSGTKKDSKAKKGKSLKSSSKSAKSQKSDEAEEIEEVYEESASTGKSILVGAVAVLGLVAAFTVHRLMNNSQRVN
jgi:tetratricopeptide (TPR) repeat protein